SALHAGAAVSLQELVPADHFYRHLDWVLDLTFVRDLVHNCYAAGGRPSVDPVVFFRLQLVMFFEGIRRGRPPLRVPTGVGVRLPRTIKHRDERGRLLRVETQATFGAPSEQPTLVPVARRTGVWRERLQALTRRTHAFAKTTTTWEALADLQGFERDWLHPHLAF